MKRTIRIEGIGIELELSKATSVKIKSKLFHLDQLPDGTWRLTYTSEMFPDIAKLKSIDFPDIMKLFSGEKDNPSFIWRGIGISSVLSKAVAANSKVGMIHLEHIVATDTWKMIYSGTLIPNINALTGLTMVREN